MEMGQCIKGLRLHFSRGFDAWRLPMLKTNAMCFFRILGVVSSIGVAESMLISSFSNDSVKVVLPESFTRSENKSTQNCRMIVSHTDWFSNRLIPR